MAQSLRESQARGLQTYDQQQAAKQLTHPCTAASHDSDRPENTAEPLPAQTPLPTSDSEGGHSIQEEAGAAWQSWLDYGNEAEDVGQSSFYQVEEEAGFPWTESDFGHEDTESQHSLQLVLTDDEK